LQIKVNSNDSVHYKLIEISKYTRKIKNGNTYTFHVHAHINAKSCRFSFQGSVVYDTAIKIDIYVDSEHNFGLNIFKLLIFSIS
jgi:hypothetical protein